VLAGCVACDPDEVCDPDDACDAEGLPVAVADEAGLPDELCPAEAGAEARAEVLLPPDEAALDRAEALPEDFWPVGDGVRVPGWLDEVADVAGVGVKMDGVADPPPPMHPVTVTASSTAPAAERPANSQPACAPGTVKRILMNPPPI
jgi:hypothetical protein